MEPVTINAEELTNVAKHLRVTLGEFSKTVERFDNSAAALMQQNNDFITRFEATVTRLENLEEHNGISITT